MDIARINLAYIKSMEEGTELYRSLKTAFKNKGRECPICVDLRGPNIRLDNFPDNKPIELFAGEELLITTNRHVDTSSSLVFCDFPYLPFFVKPGDHIIVDYGKVSLTVKQVEKEANALASIGANAPVKAYQVLLSHLCEKL